MDRKLLEIVIIDELVNNIISENQYVITEEQQNWINESVLALERVFTDQERQKLIQQYVDAGDTRQEAEQAVADAEKETETDLPGPSQDDTPGRLDPNEKKAASNVQSKIAQAMRKNGIIGAPAKAALGVTGNVLKALFGQGVFNQPDDAEMILQQLKNVDDPTVVAQRAYNALFRNRGAVGADAVSDIKSDARAKIAQLKSAEAEGETGGGSQLSKDVPLSITKRQKETKPGEGQPAEVPLNSYFQKKLGLSPQSANRLSKNIGSYLKSRGIPIAESKIKEYVAILLQEADSRPGSVGAYADYVGGTKPYYKKIKAQNDRLADLKVRLAAAKESNDRKKIRYLEKAIRTSEYHKKNLLRLLQQAKKERAERGGISTAKKADDIKATRDIEKLGAKKGTVSGILYKYLARKGKKDPKFQKMFGDDPKKLDKVAKQTRNMLRRQLKRRGYDMDSAEIKKIMLEMLIKEDIHLIKDNTKLFAEQLVKELKSRGVI